MSDSVRMVSPSGASWVTVSREKADRLRAFGFRPADTPPAAPEVAAPAKRPPRKRAPKKLPES